MSSVLIKKVETRTELKEFIEFHYDLYKGNAYDVPNLYSDELNTLRKDRNAAFDFCEAEYFLAYKDGKIVGRVAAIINNLANEKWNQKSVRFGWIDFIDDREVSAALMKAVEDYGRSKGMTEMVGPLGFTDMDPEGMLTHGFDQLGTMATIYNYPYYSKHFEAMEGYTVDNTYVEYKIFVPEHVPEKMSKIAQMIQKRYGLRVKKLTKKEIFEEGYGYKIFELINTTYSHLYGYSPLTDKQIEQYINMYFPLADLGLITLIEDSTANNKLVGVGITIPSLSKALQKCRRCPSAGGPCSAPSRPIRPRSWTCCSWACCPSIAQRVPTRCSSLTSFHDITPMASSGARHRWRWRPTTRFRASGQPSTTRFTRDASVT